MFQNSQIIQRLKHNLGAQFFGYFVAVLNQILLIPVFLHYWDKDIYANWLVLSALPVYIALSDFGLEMSAGNRMSVAVSKEDYNSANVFLHTGFVFQAFVLIILLFVTAGLSFCGVFPHWLSIHVIPANEVNWVMFLLMVRALLACQWGIFRCIYRADFQTARGVFLWNFARFVDFVVTIIAVAMGCGVMSLSVIMLIVQAVSMIFVYWDVRRTCPKLRLGFSKFSSVELRPMLKQGVAYQLLPASAMIVIQGMILVVNFTMGPSWVIVFNTVRVLCRTSFFGVQTINWSVSPELSILHGRGEMERTAKLFTTMSQICFWFSSAVAVGLVVCGQWFIHVLSHGKVMAPESILIVFALDVLAVGFWNSCGTLLVATNQHTGYAKRVFLYSCLMIPISIPLMRHFGIVGAPMATLMADLLTCPYVWFECKRLFTRSIPMNITNLIQIPNFAQLRKFTGVGAEAVEAPATEPATLTDQPLVSVLVTNYNYGRFIKQAIESLLAQTYPKIEMIIVDDGSTDNSRDVIESFTKDPRVRSYYQKNAGESAALNTAFKHSLGEIIVLMDSDDYLSPFAVATIVSACTPTTVGFHFRLRLETNDGRTLGFAPPMDEEMPSGWCDRVFLKRGSYVTLPTGKAYVRKALEKVMPIPETKFRTAGDAYLQEVIIFYGEMVAIGEVSGVWRQHNDNDHNKWQLGTDYAQLKKMHDLNMMRQEAIEEHGARTNRAVPKDLMFRDVYRMRIRFLLWKLHRDTELGRAEHFSSLSWACFKAIWFYTPGGFSFRFKHTIWYLCLLIVPRSLAPALVRFFSKLLNASVRL